MGRTEWSHDGIHLALTPRDGDVAARRFATVGGLTLVLALLVAVGLWNPPPPAPACTTAEMCRAHLPPEINPEPPEHEAWVDERVAAILDAVRTQDRLPSDVDVVDHLDLSEPGAAEWAFLAAEHADSHVYADATATGRGTELRGALSAYRRAAGDDRIHFDDDTRFVAEIEAVRSAVDRLEARARLDALAAADRSVLDLGTTPAGSLLRAAVRLAEAEWRARRSLEQTRLDEVTATLAAAHDRAYGWWVVWIVAGSTGTLLGLLGTAMLFGRARRARQPVRISVGARGIRLDGTWIDRASVVWVGLRAGALRVVTPVDEIRSRPVLDDRALVAALHEWRARTRSDGSGDRGPTGRPDPDPGSDEARVRRLLRH